MPLRVCLKTSSTVLANSSCKRENVRFGYDDLVITDAIFCLQQLLYVIWKVFEWIVYKELGGNDDFEDLDFEVESEFFCNGEFGNSCVFFGVMLASWLAMMKS